MKLTTLISVTLLILSSHTNAQWSMKHLDETSYTFGGTIKFKNDSLGLFMGFNSTLLKTIDIGESWVEKQLGVNLNVRDFQFIGDSCVYATGDFYIDNGKDLKSKFVKSDNLGETWDSISSLKEKQLHSLWFFNLDTGLIAGYDGIYRTSNAGISWDTVWSVKGFGYQYGEIKQITFPSQTVGYAIGIGRNQSNNPNFDNFVLKSKDSGITWDTLTTIQHPISTIYFINQSTGFIGTESSSTSILRTVDGGESWNEIETCNCFNSVKSIHFSSDKVGYATGAPSAFIPEGSTSFFISKTIDGGLTWETFDTTGIILNSVYFINDTVGFVAGDLELIMKSNGRIDKLPHDYPWHLFKGLGIENNKNECSTIRVYPNPANEVLFVENSEPVNQVKKYCIVNSTGQLENLTTPNNQVTQINISNLKRGIYVLKVEYYDKTEYQKFIKQ